MTLAIAWNTHLGVIENHVIPFKNRSMKRQSILRTIRVDQSRVGTKSEVAILLKRLIALVRYGNRDSMIPSAI